MDATGQRWASALGQYDFDIVYRAGLNNIDADSMSRYPFEKVEEDSMKIDGRTVKTICGNIQIDALVETLPGASINIVEATESPGQPMAQIEQRDIRRNQREDVVIGKWVRATIDRKMPKDYSSTREDKIMKKVFHSLKMIRGILYREMKDGDNTVEQLVLPKSYHNIVLQGLHNDVGHPGRDRTLSLVRERFFWPRMTADIDKWTSECHRCLRRKSPTNNRAPLMNIVTTYPLELVCMDYLTLEPSKGVGNVLVITDHFTKYALAIATKNQTAKTTAEVFHDSFITHFGIPTRIHSDQGACFESDIIKELCKITGMTKSRTTPYHPMGNPIPERFNRTLLNMLGTLEPDKKPDWKKYLPSLTYAYNCTKHETTKMSPHELMFGRKPRLPIDSMFDTPVQEVSNTTKDYIEALKKRMKTAQDIANKVTQEARAKMKIIYDRKARAPRIQIGDKVLVKILKFEGKHKIEDRYENDIYTVVGQPNVQIPVFNVRSEEGVEKTLHRNHLFLLGFINNKTEGEDGEQIHKDCKNMEKEDRIDEEKRKKVADYQSTDLDIEEKNVNHGNNDKREMTEENEYDDEDDESELEFVSPTNTTGDAWASGTSIIHEKGPVLPDKTKDSTLEKDKEKKKTDDADIDITKSKVVETATDVQLEDTDTHVNETEETDVIVEEPDPHMEHTIETEEKAEDEGATGGQIPRRSTREKKKPKRFESYVMHQVTSSSVDKRVQTLQNLIGSGIFNQLDSAMTTSILDAVMK